MGSLTATQRRRLAKEARGLADEVLSGRVPELNPYTYCGCAAHVVVTRAGLRDPLGLKAEELADLQVYDFDDCCNAPYGFVNLVSEATWHETDGMNGALVFPLLALADALEEAQP